MHALSQVHADFITHGDHRPIFEQLLVLMVELTRSERGVIAEVQRSPDGAPALQLHAVCAWPDALADLRTLAGGALASGEPVMLPAPALPGEALDGAHPPAFLGMPFKLQGDVVGVVGLGLRPGGYDAFHVSFLQPVLTTCGTLIHARREAERRHQGELALTAQQALMKKLALVAARTDNAVIITDSTGRTEWVNEGFTRITGYTLEETVGRKPGELLQGPDTDRKSIVAMSEALHRGEGITVELLNYGKSGRPYWNLIEVQPVHDADGKIVQFVAIESDVTARKQLQQQVSESAERLRLALDSAEDGLWDWNVRTHELTVSPRWLLMLGYEPTLKTSFEFWSQHLCHPEDLPEAHRRLTEHMEGRTPMYEFEHRLRHKDGSWVWVLGRAKVVERDEQGRAVRVVGINSDITSRRRAQEHLQAFIQAIPDMILRVRADGLCLGFKPSALEPTFMSPDAFLGRNIYETSLPEQLLTHLRAALQRVTHDSSLEIFEFPMEMPFGIHQYEARVVPSGPDEGTCIVRNITARKLVEEQRRRQQEQLEERVRHATRELESRQAQLIQSEKLASLGQMAASIAHEINNPVGYVSSNVSTLGGYISVLRRLLELHMRMEEALPPEAREAVAELLEQIRTVREQEHLDELLQDMDDLLSDTKEGTARIREFIQDLKTFVREESGTTQQADLNKLLQVTLRMLRHELKHKVQVRLDFGPMPLVRCYPTQLNQVFMNLLLNAAQAIEPRGDIHITTRREGSEAVVWIRDTGRGMSQETLERLFTPFFTTKPAGQGTGLGLSICYAIISRHKGRIQVDSELGKGTTFLVRLPLSEE
ncbi:PAS domain S-box protein [Hyalangium gracile]|uniref:PAS domain S-box protein n=1 Tax=Hyalangium gracile TaxID=394092 RepID=UPI001CCB69D4|nr:PAS domain S-box protein [Hyalangium gracile]